MLLVCRHRKGGRIVAICPHSAKINDLNKTVILQFDALLNPGAVLQVYISGIALKWNKPCLMILIHRLIIE
jgi:hypothetical protein